MVSSTRNHRVSCSAPPAMVRLPVLLLAIAGLLVACVQGTPSPVSPTPVVPGNTAGATTAPAGEPVELTVYGAASLKDALAVVEAAYEAANPKITLTISTGSSAALATQIAQGAPADVFLSADTSTPQKLVDGGFATGDPAVAFAGNKLTIIVPTGNPGGVSSPVDLAKAGLKIIAVGDEAPITKYANQLVANLARQPGYPAGFEAACAANVASKEDNVKAIVAKIELGEGDAGIVYVTDAAASSGVTTVDVPDSANVRATYAGVVVKASPHAVAARTFLAWLAGPPGQAILARFGFLPPP